MVHKCTSVVSAGLVSDSAESRRPAAQLSRPSFPGPGRRAGIGEFGGASARAGKALSWERERERTLPRARRRQVE